MADNLKGEHVARIGGTERILRLGIDEMIDIEARLKLVGNGGIFGMLSGGLGYTEALTVIHFALRGGGAGKQDFAATKKACEGMGLAALTAAALGAIQAAQPKDDAEGNGAAPGESA